MMEDTKSYVDPETIDLSHMRCDLSFLPAEEAAKQFHEFLCEVAKAIDCNPPIISEPNTRREACGSWWVRWQDCPWPQWAITGGGDCSGEFEGWQSLRNGVHHKNPYLGPFFKERSEDWYMETYYGFDMIFETWTE